MRKRTLHTISAAPPSIHNAFEQFQKQNEVKNLSPETIKFYSAKAKTFFLFLEDVEQRIDTITEEDVEDYILYFKEKGTVSDTTINTNLRMVRAFLYWCMERGYMERFPIRMIRADDTIKEPYTADELERLLKAPDKSTCSFAEYRNWVIVNFLLGTGCRASTLINLRIGDVDLSASTVLFQHMKTRNQIVAPLTRRLGRLLEEYLDYRNGNCTRRPFVHFRVRNGALTQHVGKCNMGLQSQARRRENVRPSVPAHLRQAVHPSWRRPVPSPKASGPL